MLVVVVAFGFSGGCFGIWLLIGYGDVLEPPLLFKESQPQIRSFGGWDKRMDNFSQHSR